jgi:hypothetical protein
MAQRKRRKAMSECQDTSNKEDEQSTTLRESAHDITNAIAGAAFSQIGNHQARIDQYEGNIVELVNLKVRSALERVAPPKEWEAFDAGYRAWHEAIESELKNYE